MASTEADIAAQLIERLLGDPDFRSEFRRDPASACRNAGLAELADEMSLGAGKAMMTLDVRESKSSLAGVMMAAAMEGVGVYQFGENILPHIDDVPGVVGDVLSRVSLPAIGLQGALAGSPEESAPAPADAGAEAEAAEAGAAANGNGAAAAAAAPPEPVLPPEEAAAGGKGDAAAKAAAAAEKAEKEAIVPPEQAAAAKIAEAESPEAQRAAEAQEAAAEIAEEAEDLPDASDLPDGTVAPQEVEEVGKGAGEHDHAEHEHGEEEEEEGHDHAAHDHGAEAAPAPPVQPAPAADVPVEAAAGGGGAAAEALLQNENLVLDADAQMDIRNGDVDPRMMALLGQLTEKHKIELSVIKTGHDQFTSGGGVSNHFVGRGIDIARVDGEIVNPGSPASRELATEIAAMTGDLRPTEVGTPWSIGAEGFFTDGAHQDHLHVAFDGEPPPGFQAPAAAAPAAAPAVAAAVPGQPAAVAEPKPKIGDSMSFQAVTAEAAAADAKVKKGDSMAFMQAVEPAPAAPVAAVAAEPAPGVAGVPADLSGVPDAYPGDDAPPEQMAAWMAKQAEARGLPPELPVMASLVESGLKNLNFGHADSVGFFQMRVGIWDQGEYAGFPEKPELQVKWFLDNAEQVKEQRIAAGESIDDPSTYGEWIADVERPAEQFRFKYQTKLEEAEGLLAQAPSAPAGAAVPAVTPAAPAAIEPAAGAAAPVEAAAGGGGASAEALLQNKNLVLDADAQKDVSNGDVDPRMMALLDKLTQKHKIELSVIKTGHDQFTSGGSVSNHFVGRGIDIARVDGEIVNPGSPAARELATAIAELQGDLRPTEVGTPWSIGAEGFFTDGAHQDHLHVAFDGEPPPGFQAPAAAAPAAAPAGAVAAAVPGQPVAAAALAEPKPKVGDSMSFQAVTAEAAAADAKVEKGDSMALMAVQPPAGPASAIAAGVVPAPVADAAAATQAGASSLGASALEVAKGELAKGVREEGTNTGVDVDKYLASAGVDPGNPWCASFVTWALEQSGHKMEGGGWAAVQTWVRAAEAGTNNLEIVSAEDARPGDIVTYDWGGQEDFGADGHIGFLGSEVKDGKFTALEGNYQDAVLTVPRETSGANVKFLRIKGDAAPGAPALSGTPLPAPGAAAPVSGAAVEGFTPVSSSPPPAPPAAVEPPAGGAVQAAAEAVTPGGGGGGAKALAALEEAKKHMGTAYHYGGSTPETGFDCSGLMQWAYAKAGIEIPRVTFDQIDQGEPVEKGELQPGDLVFFGEPEPWHVGMALGDGKFLHAPKTGDVVKVTELEGYWEGEFAGARRLDDSAPGGAPAAAPAAAAAAAPPAAAIDPAAVAKAEAAVQRDAAEARKNDSMIFMAIEKQETAKHRATVQFMKAVDPKQQIKPGDAAAAAASALSPEVAAASGLPSDASMVQAVGAPVPANELAVMDVGPIGTYPGDNASQAELAKWLGDEAERAGLPRELPVMASLVESGIKNVKGGDADSAGFFQMRVGIWDQGEYEGYRQDPRLQAKWFIDNALAVKEQRLAAGKSVTDPRQFGEWIADVERPAAEYRYKYQLRLAEARKLSS